MVLLVIMMTGSGADENQRNVEDGFADNLRQIVVLESRDLGYHSTIVDDSIHT